MLDQKLLCPCMMLNLSQDLRGPHQPGDFKFPVTTFGHNRSAGQRSFQPAWFDRYKWLHYEEKSDSAFCYTCIKAVQNNMISSSKADMAFIEKGFRNWKNATDKRKLSEQHYLEKFKNRNVLLMLLPNVRYFARSRRSTMRCWRQWHWDYFEIFQRTIHY